VKLALAAASIAVAAAVAPTPVPVLATRAEEAQPAADGPWLAWMERPAGSRGAWTVYARRAGGRPFRVSRPGASSAGAIDGTTIVTAHYGDLIFTDLVTRRHDWPPSGVNTDAQEWSASLSGDWLLFTRSTRTTDALLVANVAGGEIRTLVRAGRADIRAGNLEGTLATWATCVSRRRCTTYVHDIATGTRRTLPNPRRRAQYGPSVTSDGTVYLAEASVHDYPLDATLWRIAPDGSRTLLLRLGPRYDLADTSAVERGGGVVDVYFDRFRTNSNAVDVVRLRDRP
jgi:hypothetical protein